MKYFILVVIFACIALKQDVNCDQLSEKGRKCQNETQADAVLINTAFRQGVFPEDKKLNNYFLCLFKNIGFINEAGEFDSDKSKGLVSKMNQRTASKISACLKEPQGNGIANAVHMAKCYHKIYKAIDNN